MFSVLTYDLSWRMLCVFARMYILLLLGGMVCICLLDLDAFKILCLGFLSFNIMWLNKILFELKLSVDLWASWTWMSISLHRFGEFSAIIPLNKLAVVFSLFSFWDSQNVNSFTWWSPIIHIGFLHSFSSFCSPLNNFKWSVFEFTNPFFCLITCSADSLYYILNFIHCILKP